MSARYTSIGGKNNGRTHVPQRPISLGEPSVDRTAPWFIMVGVFVAAYFVAAIISGMGQ